MERAITDLDPHPDFEIGVVHAVAFQPIAGDHVHGAQAAKRFARATLRVVQEITCRRAHRRRSVARRERA